MSVTPKTVAVRAYTRLDPEPEPKTFSFAGTPELKASEWAVIFDTETTTDATQRLRFGAYQVRRSDALKEEGFFYDPEALTEHEAKQLATYTERNGLRLLTRDEFVRTVFLRVCYDYRGRCVGFNLPFDLSRIASDVCDARFDMHGGFSFGLLPYKDRPRLQVKSVGSKAALIRFTIPAEQPASKGMRNRGIKVLPNRGFFVDVATLARAMFSRVFSLKTLADHIETETRKMDTEEHGRISAEYLRYARADVQATWECFVELRRRYRTFGLDTPIERIYSEASLGKAHLKQMGVRPWRQSQPGFPPELLGAVMSGYFGGRAEVRLRRLPVRIVYCDFLSMYPTVCVLMNLWSFVIASGMNHRDTTEETREFLGRVELDDVRSKEVWRSLTTMVQVLPSDDVLPIRAKYDGASYNIGLNRLTSERPLWFTLADCVASKLLTGKAPTVVRAVSFSPRDPQEGLASICVAGQSTSRVDPYLDDFYRKVIELRMSVKARMKGASEEERDRLETEQMALKICANATSYGVFAELNVKDKSKPQRVLCHGSSDQPFPCSVKAIEEPGKYFHPLLATLITGAARLMLACAERLAKDEGLEWAFCDTDSMAFAPASLGMEVPNDFEERVERIRDWFADLYPYGCKEGERPTLLKVEDANLTADGKSREPLHCFAVSAKRYALFNLSESGEPMIRKASAHGLGHLRAPYDTDQGNAPEPVESLGALGVSRWQHDLWHQILVSGLGESPTQLRLEEMREFDAAAVSRYAATTTDLLRWFARHNHGKPYTEQVKPYNFLLCFHGMRDPDDPSTGVPRAVSPYDKDVRKAARLCFDRETGEPVPLRLLTTYADALSRYHLRPESKFEGGDYTDVGLAERKHVFATSVEHIGKESNRWEEQMHVGELPETQLVYGRSLAEQTIWVDQLLADCQECNRRILADSAGLSVRNLVRILKRQIEPRQGTLIALSTALRNQIDRRT